MKWKLTCGVLALVLAGALVGCSQKEPEVTTAPPETPAATSPAAPAAVTVAHDLGSVKVGDKAICVICAAKEGTSETEEVKAVIDYQGKTYAFCNEAEKAEFISSPATYVK
jgi:YHS domain-containing protein